MAKNLTLTGKKKKKNEFDLQSSVKAITGTVNKVAPKKDNKTVSTQKPQNNLLNKNSNIKEMPTFKSKDTRTIKTTQQPKKKSIQTYDVYERGGKYFYEENGKEVPIKTKYLKNAIKNNQSGVVGTFNEKGKFSETNSRGVPIKQTKEYREEKQKRQQETINKLNKVTDKTLDYLMPWRAAQKKGKEAVNLAKETYKSYKKNKNDLKQGKVTKQELKDQAIVGLANSIENSPQYKNLKTTGNIMTQMGHGAARSVEGVLDFANAISNSINNPLEQKAKVGLGLRTEEEAQKERQEAERQQSNWDARNLTDEALQKLGWNEDLYKQWENGSLVRRDNMAGQIAEGIGGMVPSLVAGQALGIGNVTNASLKGLRGAELLKGIGRNVGTGILSNAGGSAVLGASAYGSGYEEALSQGATPEQARRYGALNAGTEFATEMITGGIPGLKQTGILDNMADGLIDKATGKVTNKFLKQATGALLKMGYTGVGEGFEEALADIINPMIKNATYTDGEHINWQDVWRDFFVGGTIGTILGGGNAAVEGIDIANQQIFNQELQELNTIADQRIQQLQQEVQQDPAKAQEAVQEIEDIQRYVQAQTNTIQNQAQTQAQESETTQPNAITQETQNVAKNDKNDVLELGKTDAKSYGDLGKGRDTYYSEVSKSRGTGHFGTGTYFVTEDYEPGNYSSYANRPISRANLSDYNLYKPTTDQEGYDLHDGLKALNSKELFNKPQINELQEKYNSYKKELTDESLNELVKTLEKQGYDVENIKKDLEDGWSTRAETNLVDMTEDIIDDYDRFYKSYNNMIEQIKKNNPNISDETIEKAFNATNEALEEYNKKGYKYGQYPIANVDSLSTVFMKNLGYEGVDVRHLKGLNDTTYGTVVYDMKHNEKEKNLLNRAQEKININTIKSTIAPYYDTPLTKENYSEIKDAVDTTFRETANNLATLLGGNIKDTTNNIGGFTFEEGENAGKWVKELSYTFELENMSKDDAILFTSLMGDLAYEQQEAVIAATYENDLNNSNALEFRLKYNDLDKVMDALDKLGIHDYTIDTNNKTLNLLEFDLDKPYETVQKIADMTQEIGGNETDAKFTGIQSEYIDKSFREGVYKAWLDSNEGGKEKGELYSLVKKAYEKVKGSQESGSGVENDSFSNETALAKREEGALDKDGNLVLAPFLKDSGGGNNGGGGNNTTALGKQPQPKKGSVEADILRSYDERLKNKKKPFKERISEDMHEATRAWLDMGEEIARIGKGHNDAMLYPLYDLSKTAKASADYSINANQTNLNGEKTGDSLNKVWEEVENKNLVYEMNKYLYELHNIDRWNQFNEDGSRKYVFGPEHSDSVSRKNIADLLRLHPELERLSKPILKYQKNLSQLLVDSGIRSKAQQDALDSIYKNYVPTWRDRDDVGINATSNYGGNISINNQTKKATGSTTDLLPLKEVQALMTENIFKASRSNIFLQQLYKDIGDLDALKNIGMKNLKSNTNIEPVNSEQFYSAMEDELDKYLKESAPNNVKVEKVDGQPVATLWFNGEKVSMPIDKGIQVALEPVVVEGRAAEILNAINNIKRGLITQYNPIFAATNAIKDAADAAVNSKFSAVEYKAEYLKSFKEMLTNKKMSEEDWTLFNQYLAMGGYSNTVFDKRTGFAKPSKGAKKVVDKIGDLNDFIEQIPRFTEFKLTLKHGGTLTEAMYNAAEVTTNFKRSGVLTKKLDKLATTFFSASTAGFYKQVRNLTQQPNGKAFARFATKALALGLTPAIINSLMYANPFGDDDDKDEAKKAYKNLPQYVKNNYLVWYTGDGKFLRIPKGRVVSIPGIAYNAATNKINKEEVTFGDIAMSMLNQVGPSNPLSSNAILQIWQSGLFDNDSQGTSWSGNKIESYYVHKKPVTERYDSRTDKFSIALSKGLSKATKGKIQISPKKLSYTLEQNSGIIGDITLPWLTPKSTGSSTASRVANPIISKFVTDTVVSNKTSEKFYNEVNKYSEKKESSNVTREDLVKNSYLGNVSGEIAEKRKEIEKVESSNLSKDEKYKKTRDLQKEINALQEKGLKETGTYKNISKYVSEIGDDTYYKSSYEGRTTWKKETDKTKAIRDDLGLSAKDYYYYKNEESYTPKGGKTQYITSGKNAKYNIAMVDAFNFDPSDYLKYKHELSQIRGDKDSRGKTIPYSARNKKLKYLNSLPISSVEKAYLMKQNDKHYKSSDNNLKKAISKSNLSKKEKEEMYSYLGLGR